MKFTQTAENRSLHYPLGGQTGWWWCMAVEDRLGAVYGVGSVM